MKEFVDKLFIIILSIFTLIGIYTDTWKVLVIFLLITISALMSYLRIVEKKGILADKILEYLLGILSVFFPEVIIFIPVISYEAFLDRQIIVGIMLAAGFVISSLKMVLSARLMLGAVIGLAVFLAYRTEKMGKLLVENRKIRDEGEINKENLRKQNKNLLEEQDKSISAAQLSERNRIAREIHDNVGHMLSRSILQVGAMMVVNKDEKMKQELMSLRETLDTAMNNIRNSVHDLRDEAIDLKTALEEIAEPLKSDFNVTFEFDAEVGEISKEIKYATINIVKESVSNIIKYSKNENVDIRFYEHPSMYQIIVHDYAVNHGDGSVIDKTKVNRRTVPVIDPVSGEGMGLENIRTRAEKLGGNATFTNENGFRVFVRIPK
ncbi:MAG: hypothetical protein J5718_00690 [Lachnospiraceae bacterium]|nr:hypothetical protein [Lachnospiraceae bacterium]